MERRTAVDPNLCAEVLEFVERLPLGCAEVKTRQQVELSPPTVKGAKLLSQQLDGGQFDVRDSGEDIVRTVQQSAYCVQGRALIADITEHPFSLSSNTSFSLVIGTFFEGYQHGDYRESDVIIIMLIFERIEDV